MRFLYRCIKVSYKDDRFDIVSRCMLKTAAFWDVMACSLIYRYQNFAGTLSSEHTAFCYKGAGSAARLPRLTFHKTEIFNRNIHFLSAQQCSIVLYYIVICITAVIA
jgi:hypothetical protein